MMRVHLVLAACLACALPSSWAGAPDLSKMDIVLKSVPDGPVAVVNGQPISSTTFKDLYMGEMIRWGKINSRNVPDEERLGIAANSLRMLIEREVLYQEAVKRKITVSDADLQAKWKTEFDDLKKRVTKEGEPPISEEEALKRANTTRAEAMQDLRQAMMVDAVRDAIIKEKGVTVSDQEVSEWFTKNKQLTHRPDMLHLAQILFKPDTTRVDKQQSAAKQKAMDAYNRIKSGQSFEAVCKAVSEGQLKDKGGEWPIRPADYFPDFIVNVANKLKPGEVSEPFESKEGWHIIKLIEVVPGEEGTLQTTAPRIKEMLTAQKGNRAVSEFCGGVVKDSTKVKVYLDLGRELELRPELLQKLSSEVPDQPKASATAPAPKKAPAPSAGSAPAPRKTNKK